MPGATPGNSIDRSVINAKLVGYDSSLGTWGSLGSKHPVHSVFLAVPRVRAKVRSRNDAASCFAGSYVRSICPGEAGLRRCFLLPSVMNFLWANGSGETCRTRLWAPAFGLNLVLLSSFKYLPGTHHHASVLFASAFRAPRFAVGNLVLDVPGDELPVRSLSRRRTRSDVR